MANLTVADEWARDSAMLRLHGEDRNVRHLAEAMYKAGFARALAAVIRAASDPGTPLDQVIRALQAELAAEALIQNARAS